MAERSSVPRFFSLEINLIAQGAGGKNKTVMMKKWSLLVAAFLFGLFVSVTINACGGDKENVTPEGTQTPGETPNGDGNETVGAPCNCSWNVQKMSRRETYFENGQLHTINEYKFDDQGREIEWKYTIYDVSSNSGKYYRVFSSIDTYAYSGNTRTGTNVTTTIRKTERW